MSATIRQDMMKNSTQKCMEEEEKGNILIPDGYYDVVDN